MQTYEDIKMAYMDDEELEAYLQINPHLRKPKVEIDSVEAARIESSIKFLNAFHRATCCKDK